MWNCCATRWVHALISPVLQGKSALLSPPCSETPLIWGNFSSFPSTTWTNQNTTEKKTIQQTIFNYFIPFVHPSSSHLVRPFLVHSHPEPCSCSRSLPGKGICFTFFCCCFSLSHFSDFVGRHFWTFFSPVRHKRIFSPSQFRPGTFSKWLLVAFYTRSSSSFGHSPAKDFPGFFRSLFRTFPPLPGGVFFSTVCPPPHNLTLLSGEPLNVRFFFCRLNLVALTSKMKLIKNSLRECVMQEC